MLDRNEKGRNVGMEGEERAKWAGKVRHKTPRVDTVKSQPSACLAATLPPATLAAAGSDRAHVEFRRRDAIVTNAMRGHSKPRDSPTRRNREQLGFYAATYFHPNGSRNAPVPLRPLRTARDFPSERRAVAGRSFCSQPRGDAACLLGRSGGAATARHAAHRRARPRTDGARCLWGVEAAHGSSPLSRIALFSFTRRVRCRDAQVRLQGGRRRRGGVAAAARRVSSPARCEVAEGRSSGQVQGDGWGALGGRPNDLRKCSADAAALAREALRGRKCSRRGRWGASKRNSSWRRPGVSPCPAAWSVSEWESRWSVQAAGCLGAVFLFFLSIGPHRYPRFALRPVRSGCRSGRRAHSGGACPGLVCPRGVCDASAPARARAASR